MPLNEPAAPIQVFLSYVREDFEAVSQLYDRLVEVGLKPWMDKRDILPGQRWRDLIPQEVRRSDFVLVCLSPRSVDKRGFFQREIRTALDAWQDKLQDDIYLIPVRLEDCAVSDELAEFNWVDLYETTGWVMLLRAIRYGTERLGKQPPQELVSALEPDTRGAARQPVLTDTMTITAPLRLELVRIPAGYFLMGTRRESIPDIIKQYGGKQEWYEREAQQHQVYLSDFYMARVPMTVAQFRAFFEATGYQTSAEREGYGWVWKGSTWDQVQGASWRHPFGPGSDVLRKGDHPVTQVSWHDAQAFCQWAKVRLPSEAEWEKAARGSDGLTFPWGNQAPAPSHGNFIDTNVEDTMPVGNYPMGASPYEVLDMAGNVWEWTSSLWGKERERPEFGYPYDPQDGRENHLALDEVRRVLRGGSFVSNAWACHCASRDSHNPSFWSRYYGFRVCVSAGLSTPGLRPSGSL